jgi:Raf kinase inhibitor-like YbhB/YbcL family protein
MGRTPLVALALLVASPATAASGRFALRSPAFAANGTLPVRFTCDGAGSSPPLSWQRPPAGTRSFALVVDDPDAPGGTFTHWLVYGLPATARALPSRLPARPLLQAPVRLRQGRNSFGRIGYGAPCPPPGPAHHYVFRLLALDRAPALAAGASRTALSGAVAHHTLAVARLVGRYARASNG